MNLRLLIGLLLVQLSNLAYAEESIDATDIARCAGVMQFTANLSRNSGETTAADLIEDRVRGAFIASTHLLVEDGWKPEKAVQSYRHWMEDGYKSSQVSPELYTTLGQDCVPILEYQADVLNEIRKAGVL